MTDADKVEVTQEDREAAANGAVLMEMRDLIRTGRADHHAEIFARHRIASVAAATAEKDAEIARLKAERSPTPSLTEQLGQIVTGLRPKPSCLRAAERGYFFGYNTALAERDQLRAKLDAATTRLEYLADAIDKGEDGFDNLDGRMCCSGQMCGCGGSTNADHIVYLIRDFLSTALASKDTSHDR